MKKTEVSAGYRLSLNYNASEFKNSMLSVGVNYELTKWWKAGFEYRFYTSHLQDNHRFVGFTRLNYKRNKFTLVYRLQYQQNQDYFNEEYLQYNPPARYFRNRLQLKYELNKKLDLYGYAEPYTRLKRARFSWDRTRYAIGASYLYKKRHSLTGEVFYSDEQNANYNEDRVVFDLGYVYHFTGKGGKKKKK